jgi:hypothetical protein
MHGETVKFANYFVSDSKMIRFTCYNKTLNFLIIYNCSIYLYTFVQIVWFIEFFHNALILSSCYLQTTLKSSCTTEIQYAPPIFSVYRHFLYATPLTTLLYQFGPAVTVMLHAKLFVVMRLCLERGGGDNLTDWATVNFCCYSKKFFIS